MALTCCHGLALLCASPLSPLLLQLWVSCCLNLSSCLFPLDWLLPPPPLRALRLCNSLLRHGHLITTFLCLCRGLALALGALWPLRRGERQRGVILERHMLYISPLTCLSLLQCCFLSSQRMAVRNSAVTQTSTAPAVRLHPSIWGQPQVGLPSTCMQCYKCWSLYEVALAASEQTGNTVQQGQNVARTASQAGI